jgi:hypothetical protein
MRLNRSQIIEKNASYRSMSSQRGSLWENAVDKQALVFVPEHLDLSLQLGPSGVTASRPSCVTKFCQVKDVMRFAGESNVGATMPPSQAMREST